MSMPTLADLLRTATSRLSAAGVETARLDAQLLLAWALGCRRVDLAREPEREPDERARVIFAKAVDLRAQRRPLPYITGAAWFYGREFKVNRAVLIPRPETELLVDFAVGSFQGCPRLTPRVADVGTGSGCIAVTVALEMPEVLVVATDVSPLALRLAAKNVKRYGANERVDLRVGSFCAPLGEEKFGVIVANPPYVAASEASGLMPEVRIYEPALALYGGPPDAAPSPSAIRENLLSCARQNLESGGWIALEVGAGQAAEGCAQAEALGYAQVGVLLDNSGIARVVTARWLAEAADSSANLGTTPTCR